ncbi:MAG: peptide chain release factor N(5)-glutamine methyltransferase [Propionibacteriaceae bacterium]|nr:peptide chain release factor N(5)-glutamine methyltransferase [Propionibacteriaceae bacterium]
MTAARLAVAEATASLASRGVVSARFEADALVCHILGVDHHERLIRDPDLDQDQLDRLAELVARRGGGEPLQHLLGRAFFRTIEARVGPGVFIPRPETELLAGWAIDQIQAGSMSVVELCAGSGAISLAIAAESSPASQWAVERDPVAYDYLLANLGGSRVVPVLSDMAQALPELDGTVEVVVANPPYVPQSACADLPVEVSWDPADAVFSGEDGLDATRVVAKVAARLLVPGGVLGSEHGDDQSEAVTQIFHQAGLVDVVSHRDLTGRPRFVTARRPDQARRDQTDPAPNGVDQKPPINLA